jgi:hypothetical protein
VREGAPSVMHEALAAGDTVLLKGDPEALERTIVAASNWRARTVLPSRTPRRRTSV